jgi:hypothetical protein
VHGQRHNRRLHHLLRAAVIVKSTVDATGATVVKSMIDATGATAVIVKSTVDATGATVAGATVVKMRSRARSARCTKTARVSNQRC